MIKASSFTRIMTAAKEQIWRRTRALACSFIGHQFGGRCESKAALKKSPSKNPISIFILDRWAARLVPGHQIKAEQLQTALSWKNDLKNSAGSLVITFLGHHTGVVIASGLVR